MLFVNYIKQQIDKYLSILVSKGDLFAFVNWVIEILDEVLL